LSIGLKNKIAPAPTDIFIAALRCAHFGRAIGFDPAPDFCPERVKVAHQDSPQNLPNHYVLLRGLRKRQLVSPCFRNGIFAPVDRAFLSAQDSVKRVGAEESMMRFATAIARRFWSVET
jgi:hypothetical protein